MATSNEWDDLLQPYCEKRSKLVLTIGIIQNNEKNIFTKQQSTAFKHIDPTKLLYEIGSITKVFTGTLLAKAITENKIQLDEPITTFIPTLVRNQSLLDKPVTIRHLTTHTAGIPSIPFKYYLKILFSKKKRNNPYKYLTDEDIFKFLEKHNFQKAQRDFNYSNTGTGLLGYILAELYGGDYEAVIQQELGDLLNLSNTSANLSARQREYLVQGYTNKNKPVDNWDFEALEGAGALRSTVPDLLTFLEAHMKEEPSFFSLTHESLYEDKDLSVGMNWILDKKKQIIWHNGGTGGYSSFIGFNKEKQLGLVILSNYQPSFSKNNTVDHIGFSILERLISNSC